MTQDEAQALVNEDAPVLRLAHNIINQQAAKGNALAVALKPMVDKLHADAALLILYGNLSIPADGTGGVHVDDGTK